MKPLNLTIVGLEGASKSTSIETIKSVFREYGLALNLTKEPGGSPTADRIRNLIKEDVGGDELTPEPELLLFFASRMQTRESVVKKSLDAGESIISDRSWWCSYAYQAYKVMGDDLLDVFMYLKSRWENGGFKYDAVLFLDVDPLTGLKRASERGELDRIEKKDLYFFERAREGYIKLASDEPSATTIDANGTEKEVQEKVRAWAEQLVKASMKRQFRNYHQK